MKKFFKVLAILGITLVVLVLLARGLFIYVITGLTEGIHEEVQSQKIERWIQEDKEKDNVRKK